MALPPLRLKNFGLLTPVLGNTTIYGYNLATDNDVQFSITTLATYLSTLYASSTHTQAGSTVTGAFTASGLTLATARLLGRTTASSGAAEEISVGSGLSLTGGVLEATGGVSGPYTASALTMATARILGRTTASSGAAEEISIGSGLSLTGGILAATGGGGAATRSSGTVTINLANGATGNTTIALAKSCTIQSIELDKAGTVVVYNSVASRSADSGRAYSTVPSGEAGVIAQVTTTGAATYKRSVDAANEEGPVTAVYPIKVTNNGTSGDVIVTIGYLGLEA